jgi:hypothetical protein
MKHPISSHPLGDGRGFIVHTAALPIRVNAALSWRRCMPPGNQKIEGHVSRTGTEIATR